MPLYEYKCTNNKCSHYNKHVDYYETWKERFEEAHICEHCGYELKPLISKTYWKWDRHAAPPSQ